MARVYEIMPVLILVFDLFPLAYGRTNVSYF